MSRTQFDTPRRVTDQGEVRGWELPAFYCFADAYIGDSVQISTRNSIYTIQITAIISRPSSPKSSPGWDAVRPLFP